MMWHPGRVEQFINDGTTFTLNSFYQLHDDAWTYELTGPLGKDDRSASLAVLIPDATPDHGSFEPMGAAHVRVLAEDGSLPWPVLMWFTAQVDGSGDIRTDAPEATVTGDLQLSNNTWRFGDRIFEVNSFHFGDHDCWCYELYEVDPARQANHYLEVRIPDLNLDGGPFRPAPSAEVTVGVHGAFALPWLVLRHFLQSIADSDGLTWTLPPSGPRPPIGQPAPVSAGDHAITAPDQRTRPDRPRNENPSS